MLIPPIQLVEKMPLRVTIGKSSDILPGTVTLPGLVGVLELPVTAFLDYLDPAIVFQQSNDILNPHVMLSGFRFLPRAFWSWFLNAHCLNGGKRNPGRY
jgi:hypothetical protein